jgi:hypothetical protein
MNGKNLIKIVLCIFNDYPLNYLNLYVNLSKTYRGISLIEVVLNAKSLTCALVHS